MVEEAGVTSSESFCVHRREHEGWLQRLVSEHKCRGLTTRKEAHRVDGAALEKDYFIWRDEYSVPTARGRLSRLHAALGLG